MNRRGFFGVVSAIIAGAVLGSKAKGSTLPMGEAVTGGVDPMHIPPLPWQLDDFVASVPSTEVRIGNLAYPQGESIAALRPLHGGLYVDGNGGLQLRAAAHEPVTYDMGVRGDRLG